MNFNIKETVKGAKYANQAINAFNSVIQVTETPSSSPSSEAAAAAAAENASNSPPSLMASFIAVATGILAMISGVFGALSLSLSCIIAGIITVCLGFLIIMFEVPICCPFITYTKAVTKFSQSRPAWQKAVLYLLPPLIPLLLCRSISIFFGCILLLINGLVQVKVAMDRKISTEETTDEDVIFESKSKNLTSSGLSGSLMNEPVVTEKKGFTFNQLP